MFSRCFCRLEAFGASPFVNHTGLAKYQISLIQLSDSDMTSNLVEAPTVEVLSLSKAARRLGVKARTLRAWARSRLIIKATITNNGFQFEVTKTPASPTPPVDLPTAASKTPPVEPSGGDSVCALTLPTPPTPHNPHVIQAAAASTSVPVKPSYFVYPPALYRRF